jgi:putative phosphoesterase
MLKDIIEMKIAIFSDTHGNLKLFQKAVDIALNQNIDKIWHLGDNYEDCEKINLNGVSYKRVPGIFHPGYRSSHLDAVSSFNVEGFTVTLTHTIDDVSNAVKEASDIICYGHSHRPETILGYSAIYHNPGHLKQKFDRGYDASFTILDIEDGVAKFSKVDIFGKVVEMHRFNKNENMLEEIE